MKPEHRTADVVPSIQVLTSQLLCLTKLTTEQQVIKPAEAKEGEEKKAEVVEIKYDPSNQDKFFRYSAEEVLRRSLKRDMERLTTNEIYALMYGAGMPALREKIKH